MACYCFAMAATDTTPQAAALLLAHYRRLSPSARAQIAADLSDALRQTAMAGIRRRHPEYSDRQADRAFRELLYGDGVL